MKESNLCCSNPASFVVPLNIDKLIASASRLNFEEADRSVSSESESVTVRSTPSLSPDSPCPHRDGAEVVRWSKLTETKAYLSGNFPGLPFQKKKTFQDRLVYTPIESPVLWNWHRCARRSDRALKKTLMLSGDRLRIRSKLCYGSKSSVWVVIAGLELSGDGGLL